MSLWKEFKRTLNTKQAILIITSVLVGTISFIIKDIFIIFKFEPQVISTLLNLFLAVCISFFLAIILFFILLKLIPELLDFLLYIIEEIINLFKEKIKKHGLAKVLLFLLIICIILKEIGII